MNQLQNEFKIMYRLVIDKDFLRNRSKTMINELLFHLRTLGYFERTFYCLNQIFRITQCD